MNSRFLVVLAALLLAPAASAQDSVPGGHAEQVDAFAWMDGRWRGPARTLARSGWIALTQTERSGTMLGGRIRLVEGKGYMPDGSVGFNALGVIARNAEGGYELRSWTLESAGTFPIEVRGLRYAWNIPTPAGTVRYEGSFDGQTWRETGHLIREGQDPIETFRMELQRVDGAGWPAEGTLAPE
jgi:hypothetical protein